MVIQSDVAGILVPTCGSKRYSRMTFRGNKDHGAPLEPANLARRIRVATFTSDALPADSYLNRHGEIVSKTGGKTPKNNPLSFVD